MMQTWADWALDTAQRRADSGREHHGFGLPGQLLSQSVVAAQP